MQQQSLIIVSGSKEEMKKAAYHLYNMIGEVGGFKASIWEEKNYKDNEPTIPSSQPVIFVGETETTKLMEDSIKWSYEKMNMRYGWIGKRALVTVIKGNLSLDDYDKFKSMFQSQEKTIKDGSFLSKVKRLDKRLTTMNTKAKVLGLLLPYAWPVALYSLFKCHIDNKKIIKQQYSYIVNTFFSDSLGDFLGNN